MKTSIREFLDDCEPLTALPEETVQDMDTQKIGQLVMGKTQAKPKTKKSLRVLVVLAAVISVMAASSAVVYAATDGAVVEDVKSAAQSVSQRVKILFGGNEVAGQTAVDADGNSVTIYEGKDENGEYSLEVNDSALEENGLTLDGSLDEGIVISDQ